MQKRFWLSTHKDVQKAYEEKTALLKKDPDRVLQVRKGRDGGNIVFRLVERFKTNEAEIIQRNHEKSRAAKRHSKRRARAQVL